PWRRRRATAQACRPSTKNHLLGPKHGSLTSRKLSRLRRPAQTGADRHRWQFATVRTSSTACICAPVSAPTHAGDGCPKPASQRVMLSTRWLRSVRSADHRVASRGSAAPTVASSPMRTRLTMVAGLALVLVSGAATAKQIQFVCLDNGTCVYQCNSDRDCVAVACPTGHCDLHTPDGQLCLDDHAFEFGTMTPDCPAGKVCNGALCETACSP